MAGYAFPVFLQNDTVPARSFGVGGGLAGLVFAMP